MSSRFVAAAAVVAAAVLLCAGMLFGSLMTRKAAAMEPPAAGPSVLPLNAPPAADVPQPRVGDKPSLKATATQNAATTLLKDGESGRDKEATTTRVKDESSSPAGKSSAKAEPVSKENLYGNWSSTNLLYQFNRNGTFYFVMKNQRPTETVSGVVTDYRVWGTYTYDDGILKMTTNLVPMTFEGFLTWQEKPNLILFNQGLNGKEFWTRER
jgi:hypothetical protein